MNELQVNINQELGKIDFNYEEIKAGLSTKMSEYAEIVVTEDTTKIAKKDIAKLRKLKTALNSKRIEVKKEYDKPYEAFKARVDALTELIDEPIELIDKQVKEFEEEEKERKKEKIGEIYNEAVGDIGEYLPLAKIYNSKWENKTISLKSIKEEIEEVVLSTSMAIESIKGMKSEVEDKALNLFKSDLSLTSAIAYINKHEQMKAEIIAKQKEEEERKRIQEEERKRLAEIERAKEEERQRIREIEEAKEEARKEEEKRIAEEKAKEETELAKTVEVVDPVDINELPFLDEEVEVADPGEAENDLLDQLPSFEKEISKKVMFVVHGEPKDFDKVETYIKYIGLEYEREDFHEI